MRNINVIKRATDGCDLECRIVYGSQSVTLLGYTETYDKNGDPVGWADPNTTTQFLSCETCGKRWRAQTQHGETTFEQVGA